MKLPQPAALWGRARRIHDEDTGYTSMSTLLTNSEYEFTLGRFDKEFSLQNSEYGFSHFKISDGAGGEGNIVFRTNMDKGIIDAVLMFAYDHESHLTANIADEKGAMRQPALFGLPSQFDPVMREDSKLFWNYSDFPATHKTIFATAAVWFVDGQWAWAADLEDAQDYDGNPIQESAMVKQLTRAFKEFDL